MRIPIVNEQDEIIGHKERTDRYIEELVRATGLWVTDKDGNVLLAQRSLNRRYGPGLWGPAAGGVVEEGETPETCMLREAEEEIGLRGLKIKPGPKIRLDDCFAYFFTVTVESDYKYKKQNEEVGQLKWFSEKEINELLKEKPEIFLNDFKKFMELKKHENQN